MFIIWGWVLYSRKGLLAVEKCHRPPSTTVIISPTFPHISMDASESQILVVISGPSLHSKIFEAWFPSSKILNPPKCHHLPSIFIHFQWPKISKKGSPRRNNALAAEQIRSVSSKGGFSASSMDTKAKSLKRATWIWDFWVTRDHQGSPGITIFSGTINGTCPNIDLWNPQSQ